MEYQKILVDEPVENEIVLVYEESEEAFDKNNFPWDFEDQLYEEWRDERKMKEESKE